MTVRRKNVVADLPWDNVARRLKNGAVAIVPVGAGAKQHGLHLPMGTDQIQAEFFAARLAEHIEALIFPTLVYGTYPAFVAYAGSISLADSVFEDLACGIAGGLLDHGVRKVIVLNTGLSTQAPLERALGRLAKPALVRLLNVYGGARFDEIRTRIIEQAHGSHADEIETSIMLAIAPERVEMALAQASPPLPQGPEPGALTPCDPTSPNYSPAGSFGDPTKASREKGELLIDAILRDLLAG
jgi:creatinine amidohydrolase